MCKLRFYAIALITKGEVRLFGYRSVLFHEVTEKQDKFSDITSERNKSNVNWLRAAHQFINTSICLSSLSFPSPMAMSYGNGISPCRGARSKALVQISAEKLSARKKECRRIDCLR